MKQTFLINKAVKRKMFRYNAVITYLDEKQNDPPCNMRNWNLLYLACELQKPRGAITL